MSNLDEFIKKNRRYDSAGIGRLGYIRVDDVLNFLRYQAVLSKDCAEASKMLMENIDKQTADFDFSKFVEEIDVEIGRIS